MPGEVLPIPRSSTPDPFSTNDPDSPIHNSGHERTNDNSQDQNRMFDLLQTFQTSIDNKLGTVVNDLVSIKSTLERLETRQSALENEVHNSSLSSSVPSTPTTTPGAKRKRVTPTALQVHTFLFFYLCL